MKCGLSVVKVRREIVQLRERVEIKGSSHIGTSCWCVRRTEQTFSKRELFSGF